MPKHKKFINERVCDGCGCNFLPEKGYEKVQVKCLGCAELPELPKNPEFPKEENVAKQENSEDDSAKHTYCKKCGKEFAPVSPANKICPDCQAKNK